MTIPGEATVTVNGVEITGAAGGTVLPSPAFSADGKATTTEFTQGANGKWTLTTFAELGNDCAAMETKILAFAKVNGLAVALEESNTDGDGVKKQTPAPVRGRRTDALRLRSPALSHGPCRR